MKVIIILGALVCILAALFWIGRAKNEGRAEKASEAAK